MELEEKYKEETGYDVEKVYRIGSDLIGEDYVKWLESKLKLLNIPLVSNCDLCNGTGYISVDNEVVDCHSC